MRRSLALAAIWAILVSVLPAAEPAGKVLVIQDEIKQMNVLAKRLKSEGYSVEIVSSKDKLGALRDYSAIIVFVHGQFPQAQAEAVIEYTRAGGRMIALHHSISSGKLKTPIWLEFLGIKLPQPLRKPLEGGYGYQHGVDLRLVNLAPDHYITTNKIKYSETVEFKRSDKDEPAKSRPCVNFHDSEVFLNHTFSDGDAKTILFGFTTKHEAIGDKTWMQDRGGWLKKAGKGWAFYFMPGHTVADLESPIYQQIILNALTWKPPVE